MLRRPANDFCRLFIGRHLHYEMRWPLMTDREKRQRLGALRHAAKRRNGFFDKYPENINLGDCRRLVTGRRIINTKLAWSRDYGILETTILKLPSNRWWGGQGRSSRLNGGPLLRSSQILSPRVPPCTVEEISYASQLDWNYGDLSIVRIVHSTSLFLKLVDSSESLQKLTCLFRWSSRHN